MEYTNDIDNQSDAAAGRAARSLAHLSRRCQSTVNVKQAQYVPVRCQPDGFLHISPI